MSETNQSIGAALRDARIAKGYTLDDLQQATKIQKRYLIAIEDEQFSDLPGDFYVRAFIKQYADTVGLDGQALLDQYNDQLPSTKTQEYVDRVNDDNPSRRSAQHTENERMSNLRRRVPIVIGVLVVIVVLVGIWLASTNRAQQQHSSQVETSSVSVSGSSESTSSKAVSSSSKASSKPANKVAFSQVSTTGTDTTFTMKNAPAKKTLTLSSDQSAWSSVNVNGTSVWQGTLQSGSQHKVALASDATSVTINMGNAPATTVTVNGHKLPAAKASSSATTTESSSTDGTTDTTSASSSSTTNQVQNITIQFK
ncbi:helix-turn-helix domain-containing protein [Secundilactobacillus kimchicus]|uniref:helix-turn-helix domain-containing protein n=1 Tax=Secundilactobacillus kimchicus TaxID=528209 RepID=UPI0024AA030D|nr:helix-turn-helix domain-containing protein [Secundilactobacillus kimchicus]